MKTSLLALATWMAVVSLSFGENLAVTGYVIPGRDIVIAHPAPFEFGWTAPGQTYDCLGQTRDGYHVLVSKGDMIGIAFLPFRDEWGHATAESWPFNPQLSTNTIVAKAPVRLSPGSLILKKGLKYPAIPAAVDKDDKYTVTFTFKTLATTVTVDRAQLQSPEPEEMEAAIKATELMKELVVLVERNEQLTRELQEAQAATLKLEEVSAMATADKAAALTAELAEVQKKNAQLEQELKDAQAAALKPAVETPQAVPLMQDAEDVDPAVQAPVEKEMPEAAIVPEIVAVEEMQAAPAAEADKPAVAQPVVAVENVQPIDNNAQGKPIDVKAQDIPEAKPLPEADAPKQIEHIAIGAKIQASSTHVEHAGEGMPEAMIDGDLTTRWSSEYTEPQEILVDLGKPVKIAKLRLHWETASAVAYRVSVSSDGETWNTLYDHDLEKQAKLMPRLDSMDMANTTASQIRLELLRRINPEWGFSLYEIEVIEAK